MLYLDPKKGEPVSSCWGLGTEGSSLSNVVAPDSHSSDKTPRRTEQSVMGGGVLSRLTGGPGRTLHPSQNFTSTLESSLGRNCVLYIHEGSKADGL